MLSIMPRPLYDPLQHACLGCFGNRGCRLFDVGLAEFPHTVCPSISLWIVVVRSVIISAFAVTSDVPFFLLSIKKYAEVVCNIQKSRIFALGDYHQQSVVSSRVALHILFRRQGGGCVH